MLDFPEMNGQTHLPKSEQHSPLPMFLDYWLRPLQRLDTLATPDFAATVTAFSCTLTYAR